MKNNQKSIFGEIDNKKPQIEKIRLIDKIIVILAVLGFPFYLAGIIYGAKFNNTILLIVSISLLIFFVLGYVYIAFIIPAVILKKGEKATAIVTNVVGSNNITYEYTNNNGIRKKANGVVGNQNYSLSNLSMGSTINIKIYKGRSIIIK